MSEIETARKIAPIASVQNLYNLAERHGGRSTANARASASSMSPLRRRMRRSGPLPRIAIGATCTALALAWLLQRSRSPRSRARRAAPRALVQLSSEQVRQLDAAIEDDGRADRTRTDERVAR